MWGHSTGEDVAGFGRATSWGTPFHGGPMGEPTGEQEPTSQEGRQQGHFAAVWLGQILALRRLFQRGDRP